MSTNKNLHNSIKSEPASQSVENLDLVEQSSKIEMPYGVTESKQWLFDGIRIGHKKQFFNGYYSFTNDNDLDVVSLSFNIKGKFLIHHVGNEYRVKGRQHNVIYSKGISNTYKNEDLQSETFEVQFSPQNFLKIVEGSTDSLKRFADDMLLGKPVVLSSDSPFITPDLQSVINDILNCRFDGRLKKLFLLSKSIELLVLQAEAHERATKGLYLKKEEDKERILFARNYLIENMDTPPSLTQLARICGINEYKLKRGFKEAFGTTVFGYLSDYRLEKAKQTLIDTSKSISEIAVDLGYSSPQHFSSAFKKKFSMAPTAAKK